VQLADARKAKALRRSRPRPTRSTRVLVQLARRWYAAYMTARQSGSTPDEASASAARYMKEVKHFSPDDLERLTARRHSSFDVHRATGRARHSIDIGARRTYRF
jgi:hypothetical protein